MTVPDRDQSPDCPDAEVLAAWSEHTLERTEYARVETHVADCGRCQMHLAAMARMAEALPAPEPERAPFAPWRWLVPTLAGATALALWVAVQPPNTRQPTSTPSTGAAPPTDSTQPANGAPPVAQRFEVPVAGDSATAPAAPPPQTARLRMPPPEARREAADERTRNQVRQQLDASRNRANEKPLAKVEKGQALEAPAADAPATLAQRRASIVRRPDLRIVPFAELRVERSADGRVTWQPQAGLAALLTAGSSPAPNVIWLVGRGGLVLLSTDQTTWRRLPFPEVVDLAAITATNDTRATVTTADGRTFTTTDAGAHWTQAPLQDFSAAPF